MFGDGSRVRRGCAKLALALLLMAVSPLAASAQMRSLAAPQSFAPAPLTGGIGSPGATIVPLPQPVPPALPPVAQSAPIVPAGQVALAVSARYGRDTPQITGGLIWRVYPAKPDLSRPFVPIKEEQRRHAGIPAAARRLCRACLLRPRQRGKVGQPAHGDDARNIRLAAGGIGLEGRVGDARIPGRADHFRRLPGQPI